METRVCRYCQQEWPIEKFGQAATIKGKMYRRHRCTDCKNKLQTRRIQKGRCWLEDYKKERACDRCKYSDHRALTFHHLDPNVKEFNIADMARLGRSREAIEREIAKCTLICANCHAIEHYHEPKR